MIEQALAVLAVAIAIDQATDILSSVDLLEGGRAWFRRRFPSLAKLTWCNYCQSFWLSGMAGCLLVVLFPASAPILCVGLSFVLKWLLLWMVLFGLRNYINQASSLVSAAEEYIRTRQESTDQDLGS